MADDSDKKNMKATDVIAGGVLATGATYGAAAGYASWNAADAKDKDGNKLEGQKHGVVAAETKHKALGTKYSDAWKDLEEGANALKAEEKVLLDEAKAAAGVIEQKGKFVDEVIQKLHVDGKAKAGAEEVIKRLQPVATAGKAVDKAALAVENMGKYVGALGEERRSFGAVAKTMGHAPIAFAAGTAIVALLGAMAMNRWRSSGQPDLDTAGARSR